MSKVPAKRCRTFRYRLRPTARQSQALLRQLNYQRELYNAALEERIGAWNWERRSVSLYDQQKTLTSLKDVRPEVVACGIVLCRGTLQRLDLAFSAFFRRIERREAPGFPRFQSAARWSSLQWGDASGWKLTESHRLRLYGIGEIKLNYHRPTVGTPKGITIKLEGRKRWVSVRCVDVPANPLSETGREIGIDLGIVNLVATSEGELLKGEQFGAKTRSQLAQAQRHLSNQRRGSARRQRQVEVVARLHRKVTNQRQNTAHQLSRRLVNNYDFIAIEDLNIRNMARSHEPRPDESNPGAYLANGAARKRVLNRSIYNAGWGTFVSMIVYKAECAGRTVVSVNPHHSSQRCAMCSHTEDSNRVNQAVFRCQRCGHEDHADLNAARNILRAGRAQRISVRAGSD